MEADESHISPLGQEAGVYVCDTGSRCFRGALKYSTSNEKQMFAEMFAARLL